MNRSSRSTYSEISTPAEQTLALQRILQLLPQVNRDTLFVLLHFLGLVADNSEDKAAFEEGEYHLWCSQFIYGAASEYHLGFSKNGQASFFLHNSLESGEGFYFPRKT